MVVKSLEHIDFEIIIDCFLKAFENYFVKMPTDPVYYEKRWEAANVQYSQSYGMFDEEKLVGFIINAIGIRNGKIMAFNTGTGVIPAYRGKHIINSIYQYAIPKLKKIGVNTCSLEVITDNTIAIKVYERIGFKKIKKYHCYSGELALPYSVNDFELKKVDVSFLNWDKLHQEQYSWDNHIETVKKGSYDYFVVEVSQQQVAYFIINPKNGYVAQFDVLIAGELHWKYLFSAIYSVAKSVKINNVDERLERKVRSLNQLKLENTVDQFEMILPI